MAMSRRLKFRSKLVIPQGRRTVGDVTPIAYTCPISLTQRHPMSFSPVSKADWLRQVEQDLKGKPPSSVAAEWWPGEPIDPFLDASDEPGIVSLPDEWFVRTPL